MKLKFDASLDYQLDAVNSIANLFEGMTDASDLGQDFGSEDQGSVLNTLAVRNALPLSEEQLLANLHGVQKEQKIPKSRKLIEDDSPYPSIPNFSIEMETGTGKTYVYLRTIFELNARYGLKKFIVVVPSVAIREGVTSSIALMKEHFQSLYNKVPFDHFLYTSKDLNAVRNFAVNNEIQIMVINIQAFQKDAGDDVDFNSLSDDERKKLNIIHQEQDKMNGFRPIEFIQSVKPIIIIDEPQSVDTTDKSQRAIRNLNPLCIFRFSATHTTHYNLVYQLDPIKAYDLRLVKHIEVLDASDTEDYNKTLVRLDSVSNKKGITAKISIYENKPSGPAIKQVTVKAGDDLADLTNRSDYREGYFIEHISAEPGNESVEFQGGETVYLHQETGGMADIRMKSQIHQTVAAHFEKELKLKQHGIKVLSLFFIDHVKSYRSYDSEGNRVNEKLVHWFEEAYTTFASKPKYKELFPYAADQVHDGYFSGDKKKGLAEYKADKNGNFKTTAGDEDTFHLIMKDKERLLSSDVPLRFIFSHSALREGWDNPNVFQICTLREMGTDRERRQTIGRGLRLPVNSSGDRVKDDEINRLTVIANETFENFAKGLQEDIELAIDESGGFKFGRITKNSFIALLNPDGSDYLTQEQSVAVWSALNTQGLIDKDGQFTEKFQPDNPLFRLNLPDEFVPLADSVLDRMKKFLPRDFVKDGRKKALVKYNKRVELNEDFKVLWDKIKQKTKYSVEFETADLIDRAQKKILNMQPIEKNKIEIKKIDVKINEAGVSGVEKDRRSFMVSQDQPLPDILSFLQKETELTRKTLVEILKGCGRLNDFSKNPQVFMTEVAKMVNRAVHELIVDGIKYEPLANQFYDMRLFQEKEVEEYLSRLYEVQSSDDRTPFNFIVYDSDIEHTIAKKLDQNVRVKFFCKLPRWFKVQTPVGDYNPDWAVVVQNQDSDDKLYLVRETKSTKDQDERRQKENRKVKCGMKHFESIGVDFTDAVSVMDVLN